MPVRVALVEDHPAFRQRLAERLRFFDAVTLTHTAEDGERFLRMLEDEERLPQVVLMDIEMPGLSGIETTRRLKAAHPGIDVLMLTVFEHDESIFTSIRAGASGYLLKDTPTAEVVRAVLELTEGGAPMSPGIARRVLERARTAASPAPAAAFDLTDRERELLQHLVDGSTEEAIAEALFISPHTVRTHIKNIYKKLHVHSRAAVVRTALEHRLLTP